MAPLRATLGTHACARVATLVIRSAEHLPADSHSESHLGRVPTYVLQVSADRRGRKPGVNPPGVTRRKDNAPTESRPAAAVGRLGR